MVKPHQLIEDIAAAMAVLRASDALNPSQQLYVQHMHARTQQLHATITAIPATDYALQRIVPMLDDNFMQAQMVIYGYAKMLLDQPTTFDGAEVPAALRPTLDHIYDVGLALQQLTERIKREAFAYRKANRDADPAPYDLNMIIWQNIPVYRYLLRDVAIKLTVAFPQGLPPVRINPYHVSEIVQHIIVVMGTELMAYGAINVTGTYAADPQRVLLAILGMGLRLTEEERARLFQRQGRDMIRQRLTTQDMTLTMTHEAGSGGTITLGLPVAQTQ